MNTRRTGFPDLLASSDGIGEVEVLLDARVQPRRGEAEGARAFDFAVCEQGHPAVHRRFLLITHGLHSQALAGPDRAELFAQQAELNIVDTDTGHGTSRKGRGKIELRSDPHL